MEHASWLFGEAWEHRHRRRRAIASSAVAASAALILVLAYSGGGGTAAPGPPGGIREPSGTIVESPSAVLSQSPYMGVRCPVANSIACDQVGLAIWLKHPARSVTASIDGRRLAMDRFGDRLTSSTRPRTAFDGYLRPAGITSSMHVRPVPGTRLWLGDPTPSAAVWLLIDYGSGRHVATHLQVPLMAGWG
jgi:hypothetical protein